MADRHDAPRAEIPQIEVRSLSKVYKVYWGPRALVKEFLLRIPSHHRFEALREINFEVDRGEALGVIGDNGAGKSTLLKILAGTTFPTQGTAKVLGSVAALLELGTGFHPEFSGRQNIFFSGALAGLSREEIRKREEAIIAFSELEEFIDQPVKTYSSGMYLRLGFSVATGFEPDLLIIDEALAVGDQGFQKKCTDRILEFKKKGITILFCSHNLHQVRRLCDRVLWLDRGSPVELGPSEEVVARYRASAEADSVLAKSREKQGGRDRARVSLGSVENVSIEPATGAVPPRFKTGDTLRVDVTARFASDFPGVPSISVAVLSQNKTLIYMAASALDGFELKQTGPEEFRASVVFPEIQLLSGDYSLNVSTSDEADLQAYDIWEGAQSFTVVNPNSDSGLVRLSHHWTS